MVVVIIYRMNNRTYRTRVTYKRSATIIAGLITTGAKVTAVFTGH